MIWYGGVILLMTLVFCRGCSWVGSYNLCSLCNYFIPKVFFPTREISTCLEVCSPRWYQGYHTFMTACVLKHLCYTLFSSMDGMIISPSLIKVILWKIKPIGFYSKESDLSSITFLKQ